MVRPTVDCRLQSAGRQLHMESSWPVLDDLSRVRGLADLITTFPARSLPLDSPPACPGRAAQGGAPRCQAGRAGRAGSAGCAPTGRTALFPGRGSRLSAVAAPPSLTSSRHTLTVSFPTQPHPRPQSVRAAPCSSRAPLWSRTGALLSCPSPGVPSLPTGGPPPPPAPLRAPRGVQGWRPHE